MDQVHVEAIGLQPRQALVDLLQDVPARQPAIVRPGPDRIEHLRAEEQLLPDRRSLRLQPSADVAFAAAAAVRVGGVEEIDAGIDRAIHQVERLRLGLAHAEKRRRRADAAEVAAAEPQARNLKAGRSQSSIVHGVEPNRCSMAAHGGPTMRWLSASITVHLARDGARPREPARARVPEHRRLSRGVDHGPGVVISSGRTGHESRYRRLGGDAAVRASAALRRGSIVIVQPLRQAAATTPPPAGSKPGEAPFTGMSFNPIFETIACR